MISYSIQECLLLMSYENIVQQLHRKYGFVKYNYFDEKGRFNKKNKISEYLQIHHIDGYSKDYYKSVYNINKNKEYAKEDVHKAENLVYCNYLEHLLLHLKIYIEQGKGRNTLINYMIPRLVDKFSKAPEKLFAKWDYNQIVFMDIHSFCSLLKYIFKMTDITKDELVNKSYLEVYGTEKWINGRKYHFKNEWTHKNNKVFWDYFDKI